MNTLRRTATSLVIILALLSTACPKKSDVVFWSEQVVGAAEELLPILRANGRDTLQAERLVFYGKRLVAAVKADDGTAVSHAEQCIILLQVVANDAQFISNPTTRTLALAILGLINRYLHSIADQLPAAAVKTRNPPPTSSVRAVKVFAAKKVWRCRDSVTGRFAKMEYCKANPATTTVEVR